MLAALIAVLAAGAWYFLLRDDSPAPVSLADAAAAAANSQPAPGSSANSDPTGRWNVVQGDATFAGYRIQQQVAGIGSQTVVGRTGNVTGSLDFDGSAITDAQVTVDMSSLKTDESLRDSTLRSEAIETSKFPTATFKLTQPVSVTQAPAQGQQASESLMGDLTLHGVTRPVQLDVQGVIQGGSLVVVGSQDIKLADFGISPPRGPASVLSVADHGSFEVQLVLTHA